MKIRVVNKSKLQLPEYATKACAGITILNSTGTINAEFKGEDCIILVNLSSENFVIRDRDRICKMVIANHEKADWIKVESLIDTERGIGGFGHTGKN